MLEVGEEERVVVLGARFRPDVVAVRGRTRHLGRQLGRDAPRFLPVAARGADQGSVVGVVVQLRLVAGEVVEQRPDLVRDELLVRDPVERRDLGAANGATAGRHHHGLVPEEDLLRSAQVVDLGQA